MYQIMTDCYTQSVSLAHFAVAVREAECERSCSAVIKHMLRETFVPLVRSFLSANPDLETLDKPTATGDGAAAAVVVGEEARGT